jgi:hypothetical protein
VPGISKRQIRDAIAEALWAVSANELADVCDELGMASVGPEIQPMASKRAYVRARLPGLKVTDLLSMARKVLAEVPNEELALVIAHADNAQGGVPGELRNIIFAATGAKPRIVIRDALNNDIELIEGADRCIVYDEPLSQDGLTWRELVRWWAVKSGLDLDAPDGELTAARRLFERLGQSLDNDAEKFIAQVYGALYGQLGFGIPALLPQVYLHYDPYAARELGGRPRLFRQRMDFLLLLPHRIRVVLELDGKQHYSEPDGSASPARYAHMASEDRILRLAGYEVYRFGGQELVDRTAAGRTLTEFFAALLAAHGITGR